MATYTKETALYDTGAIATDIANAGTTATSYITRVDATNGIRVHDLNESTDFVQVNSSAISMYRGGTAAANEKVRIEDDEIRVGATTTGHAILDEDGMDVFIGDTSVAHYGDYARVGKEGEANTTISPNEVLISAGDDINALRITPNGNTQTVTVRVMRRQLIAPDKTTTLNQPADADAGSNIRYVMSTTQSGSDPTTFIIQKGQSHSTTDVTITSTRKFRYSATSTQVTIKNIGTADVYLYQVLYSRTTASPLTEVGGALALGSNSEIAYNVGAVLVVGNGSEETPHTSLAIYKNGDVYINGTQVLPLNLESDSLTVTNWNVVDSSNTGTLMALRRGGTVTIKLNGVKFKATSSRTNFATIPVGFRPATEIANLVDSSNTCWFFCRPDGSVAIQGAAASTYWGACTFLLG